MFSVLRTCVALMPSTEVSWSFKIFPSVKDDSGDSHLALLSALLLLNDSISSLLASNVFMLTLHPLNEQSFFTKFCEPS